MTVTVLKVCESFQSHSLSQRLVPTASEALFAIFFFTLWKEIKRLGLSLSVAADI
jgi:hypothetical protein